MSRDDRKELKLRRRCRFEHVLAVDLVKPESQSILRPHPSAFRLKIDGLVPADVSHVPLDPDHPLIGNQREDWEHLRLDRLHRS